MLHRSDCWETRRLLFLSSSFCSALAGSKLTISINHIRFLWGCLSATQGSRPVWQRVAGPFSSLKCRGQPKVRWSLCTRQSSHRTAVIYSLVMQTAHTMMWWDKTSVSACSENSASCSYCSGTQLPPFKYQVTSKITLCLSEHIEKCVCGWGGKQHFFILFKSICIKLCRP